MYAMTRMREPLIQSTRLGLNNARVNPGVPFLQLRRENALNSIVVSKIADKATKRERLV